MTAGDLDARWQIAGKFFLYHYSGTVGGTTAKKVRGWHAHIGDDKCNNGTRYIPQNIDMKSYLENFLYSWYVMLTYMYYIDPWQKKVPIVRESVHP